MQDDLLLYKEVKIDSFQFRLFKLYFRGIAVYLIILFSIYHEVHDNANRNIAIIISLFFLAFLLLLSFADESQKVYAINIYQDKLIIKYSYFNKEETVGINFENLTMDFKEYPLPQVSMDVYKLKLSGKDPHEWH